METKEIKRFINTWTRKGWKLMERRPGTPWENGWLYLYKGKKWYGHYFEGPEKVTEAALVEWLDTLPD